MELNKDGLEPNTPLTFEQVQALARKHSDNKNTSTLIPKKQTRENGVMSQDFAKTAIK